MSASAATHPVPFSFREFLDYRGIDAGGPLSTKISHDNARPRICVAISRDSIVTRDEEETVPVDAGRIDVVPAWRFLLDLG